MPDFPIIDSHIHLFDLDRLSYGWVEGLPPVLRRSRSVAEFRAAIAGIAVEQAVVIEYLVDPGLHLDEARYGAELMREDAIVGAIVAHASVERGAAVEADLQALVAIPGVRAIRRILDGQYDRVLEPDFIEGVRLVGRFGLPFELGISHYGLVFGLELARRCPDTLFILDHLATPAIRYGIAEPWRTQVAELARLPNVVAKISGVMAGVDPDNWTAAQITPYLAHAIDCFGFDRLMFGSDWPMLTPVLSYRGWLDLVEGVMLGTSEHEKRQLFRDTATRIYRL